MRYVALIIVLMCMTTLYGESVDRIVLPSGLTIVTSEKHTSRAVEIRVVVRAGPNFEREYIGSGLSALTQRLILSSGTEAQTATQIREIIAKLGDQTATELTPGYSTYALTTTTEDVGTALQIMATRLTGPVFTTEDLDRERNAMSLLPADVGNDAMMALMYRQHPARLPLTGIPALRNTISLEQIQAYHQQRYRTANTVVMVCGNINSLEARRLVEQAFASYPVGGFAAIAPFSEPPPLAPRYQVVNSAAVRQPRVTITWRTESIDNAVQPGLAVLVAMLAGDRGVVTRLLRPKGLGDDIQVHNITPLTAPGYIRLSFTTSNERRAEAEQVIYKGLEALAQDTLEDNMVAAAKARAVQLLLDQQSTVRGLTNQLVNWELTAGDPGYGRRFIEQIQDVDSAEVLRVLRRYILSREGDRGRCTVVVRPVDQQAPPVSSETVKAPNPSSVVMPEVTELAHGVRLLMRPTLEQPLVTVGLVLGGGASVEDKFQHGATALLSQIMCRATTQRTSVETDDLINRLGMRLTTGGTQHRLSVSLTCFPKDVGTALELLTDWFTNAALLVEDVEMIRQRATSDNMLETWQPRFLSDVRSIVLGDHYGALDPKCLKTGYAHLDRSVLLAHYKRLTVGANAVITVYGNFDRMMVLEKASALLNTCPNLSTAQTVNPEGIAWGERQSSLTVTTHDHSQSALALVWRGPTLAERERDDVSMQVLSALLEARLQRIAGIIPGTQLFTRSMSFDKRGLWMVWGSCDPGQIDAVQQAVRDEVARFIAQLWLPEADRGAFPESELIAARSATAVRWALMQEDLQDVATMHATMLLLGQDLGLDVNRPQRIAAIGRKDLLRVAQAWLTGEPIAVIANPKTTTVITPPPTNTPKTSVSDPGVPASGTKTAPAPTESNPPNSAQVSPAVPTTITPNPQPVKPSPNTSLPVNPVPVSPTAPQPAQPVPVSPQPNATK